MWQNLLGIFLTPFLSIVSIKINGCFLSNGNIYLKKDADVEAEILVKMMNNKGHDYSNCWMRNLTSFYEGNVPFFKQKGHMLTLITLNRPAQGDIPKISLGTIFQTKTETPSLTQYRLSCIILSCSVRLSLLKIWCWVGIEISKGKDLKHQLTMKDCYRSWSKVLIISIFFYNADHLNDTVIRTTNMPQG